VAHDLLAIADAAGADRFAYYGYSWLALAGLQLAIRTDRLTALAMGGFPPLGGPYAAMLAVTRAAHRQARDARPQNTDITPGDWESSEVTATPAQTGQYVTLYESLRGFDESAVELTIPRFAFAGADDVIRYPAAWDDARVDIGPALAANRAELEARGWRVELLPGRDHLTAMHAEVVREWLRGRRATPQPT
jgi:pimeloyl-ACP methyl ester carboxylesterase